MKREGEDVGVSVGLVAALERASISVFCNSIRCCAIANSSFFARSTSRNVCHEIMIENESFNQWLYMLVRCRYHVKRYVCYNFCCNGHYMHVPHFLADIQLLVVVRSPQVHSQKHALLITHSSRCEGRTEVRKRFVFDVVTAS